MTSERWPALPLASWRDTYATLHMWSQVVGKISLALTPPTNHFWNIAMRIGPRGLVTPLMSDGRTALTITLDFVDHQLVIHCADGRSETIPLAPMSVATFYRRVMEALARLGVGARIWTMPVEVPDPVRFEEDEAHHSYDSEAAARFWQAIVAMTPVFERFRGGFIGKSSPVHFFWGSFDLAVTRFSGRRAPEREGADAITRESYSHEVISHGFWPGSGPVQEPAFYSYAAPEPDGLKAARVSPAAAFYSREMNEFLLPYEAVRTAPSPETTLAEFLTSTYDAAAERARWSRGDLERH